LPWTNTSFSLQRSLKVITNANQTDRLGLSIAQIKKVGNSDFRQTIG